MEPYAVIKHPLSTEKSIRLMEAENKLIFVVSERASKKDIKDAAESIFKAKVEKVNTFISNTGQKRAYIKFTKQFPAIDIATQMGMM